MNELQRSSGMPLTVPRTRDRPMRDMGITHPEFDPTAWIEQLAATLEAIAPTARPTIANPPEYTRSICCHEYRALTDHAKHDEQLSLW